MAISRWSTYMHRQTKDECMREIGNMSVENSCGVLPPWTSDRQTLTTKASAIQNVKHHMEGGRLAPHIKNWATRPISLLISSQLSHFAELYAPVGSAMMWNLASSAFKQGVVGKQLTIKAYAFHLVPVQRWRCWPIHRMSLIAWALRMTESPTITWNSSLNDHKETGETTTRSDLAKTDTEHLAKYF